MNIQDILAKCDHTLLSPAATWAQIQTICDEGMQYHTASVCIPASYVAQAKAYVGDKLPICTVIGFPNGYDTTAAKCFMATDAVNNGAGEVDMVVNLGWVADGKYDAVEEEIRQVKAACQGKILKVIIETCLLNDQQKVALCGVVTRAGADFIKTSTGFSTGGATVEDVKLFREHVSPDLRIKAAGGIHTFQQAQALLEAGADRIGASALAAAALGK